jgi:Tol biopolymer transport system component
MSIPVITLALSATLAGCEILPAPAARDEGSPFAATAQTPGVFALAATDTVTTTTRRLEDGTTASDVSRDGRRIVFSDPENGAVTIRDLDSGEVQRVTPADGPYGNGWAFMARFSADGRRVAFWWVGFTADAAPYGIHVASLDHADSGPRVIYAPPEGSTPARAEWSPDGQWLLTARRAENGVHQLIRVPASGGEPQVLQELGWRAPYGVAYSPDGRFVAFDVAREGFGRDIHVLAADGGASSPVVAQSSNDYLLGWSPDGHIFFSSDRSGTPGVWRVRVANGRTGAAPELLRPDLWRVAGIGFDDRGRFYYTAGVGSRDVHVASMDPATGRMVVPLAKAVPRAPGGTRSPAWSPDGRSLAYLANRSPIGGDINPYRDRFADAVVMIRSLETGTVRELQVPPQAQELDAVTWAPDGRSVYMVAQNDQGSESLLRVDVQTGEVERTRIDGLARPFRIHPDGEHLVMLGGTPGSARPVVLRHLETGQERVVVEAGGPDAPGFVHGGALSPDGSLLAVALWDPPEYDNSIRVYPIGGGEPREVIRTGRPIWGTSLAWTPDGSALLYATRVNEGPEGWSVQPWRVELADGEARPLELLPRMTTEIHPHPDGRRFATVSGSTTLELWVMENIGPVQARATDSIRR